MKFLIFAVLVLATGCSSHRAPNANSAVDTTIAAATADPHRGRQLFANKCAACHGANGQGASIGPTLRNERARKNLAQTAAWIKDPDPPMPKLYPAELTAKDVADVAAFVQSL
jgi:mono/diheme cytochrome c family protein